MIHWQDEVFQYAVVGFADYGTLGYAIGAPFTRSIGDWAIESFSRQQDFDSSRARFNDSGLGPPSNRTSCYESGWR